MRSITAATLILFVFVGCRSGILGRQESISYAQYNSLQAGLTVRAVVAAFGEPRDVLEKDGRIRGLGYLSRNADGVAVPLKMVFDERGRLTEWALP